MPRTTGTNSRQGRSRISSRSKDLVRDNGAILLSVIDGEQVHLEVTLNWLVNLTGYQMIPKIVEADMTGIDTRVSQENPYGEVPTQVLAGGRVVQCATIDDESSDNKFKIVIPENLTDGFVTLPKPDVPVYAWFGLEVRDSGAGANQQVWKPMRGLLEILYSPSEATTT